MRKISWLAFISVLFLSCSTIKVSTQTVSKTVTVKLPDSLDISNNFRMFWDDMAICTNNFAMLSSYKPTSEQIAYFNLKKQGKQYFVNGFLKTKAKLTYEQISAFSGNIRAYSDNMYGFSIPLGKLPNLIHLTNLTYIELSSNVFPRKANAIK